MMENSASSSLYKAVTMSGASLEVGEDSVAEESGWTQYIQDFEEERYGDEKSSSCYSYMSYSMLSDAGSGPERKNNKYCINPAEASICQKFPRKLNFNKKIPFDDSLEDTASSPVNSPKITTYFKRMDINSRKMDSETGSPMGNEIPIEEHLEYNNNINRDDDFKNVDCIDLKQKGLCVVPVSMVVNYLG